MPVYLTNEKVREIFKQHGGNENNSGAVESQIALFTYRIQSLSEHLKTNAKDQSCKRTLLTLVGKRKRFLRYLQTKDIQKYRALIETLGIRK